MTEDQRFKTALATLKAAGYHKRPDDDVVQTLIDAIILHAIKQPDPDAEVALVASVLREHVNEGELVDFKLANEAAVGRKP